MASPEQILEELLSVPGVEAAVASDKDGLLLASAGLKEDDIDMDALGAVASGALSSAEFVGEEFKKGLLERVVLEYQEGKVILQQVGKDVVLAIFASKEANLGIVRLTIKRKQQEILDSFSF
ncbi:MAG TPA: roadblock/LC7 domain-containing protein [Candidatus Eremiobacteraeota bacterium]|nr:MAG: Roadblock/LC7 domain protein [bacterium ADurb.Bin363]HPZ07106.1 roadblock/LC7 domain-containing protein [Candidatus Eremiobacteraeota bacterium]